MHYGIPESKSITIFLRGKRERAAFIPYGWFTDYGIIVNSAFSSRKLFNFVLSPCIPDRMGLHLLQRYKVVFHILCLVFVVHIQAGCNRSTLLFARSLKVSSSDNKLVCYAHQNTMKNPHLLSRFRQPLFPFLPFDIDRSCI